jgi:hypothetical protein
MNDLCSIKIDIVFLFVKQFYLKYIIIIYYFRRAIVTSFNTFFSFLLKILKVRLKKLILKADQKKLIKFLNKTGVNK